MVDKKLPPVEVSCEKKPIPASEWLTRYVCVGQMVWIPGEDQVIQGRIVVDGGVIEAPGQACFNTYLPPVIVPGDKMKAAPWRQHVETCFPDDYTLVLLALGIAPRFHRSSSLAGSMALRNR